MKNKYYFYMFFPPLFQTCLFFLTKFFEKNFYDVTFDFEKMIPYISFFAIFYIMWYILLFLSPIIIYKFNNNVLKEYFITYLICTLISTLIFILFPTMIVRPEINSNTFFDKLVNYIYINDTPAINCFPSLHTLYSIVWIKYIGFNNKVNNITKIIINIICILIILSTLFIKQHSFIDLIGSMLVFVLGYNCSKLIIKK